MIINDRFLIRRGLAADLATVNEVPLEGEWVWEMDQGLSDGKFKLKIGDGTTPYNDLKYLQTGSGAGSIGQLSGLNDQTGTSYTVAATDAGKDVRCTNVAAVAFNIDTQASVPVAPNFWCLTSQGGAGIVTVTALTGVTLRAANGAATLAIYDARGVERITGDEWRVW